MDQSPLKGIIRVLEIQIKSNDMRDLKYWVMELISYDFNLTII
jgi:hypothetical protein